VKPTVVVERVETPLGDMTLLTHDGGYAIRVSGVDLMSSRDHRSEDELGRRACRDLTAPAPRVLIGGLGLGFTLRAALDVLPAAARIDVVELVPAVVRWNREVLGALARHPLHDARVTLIEGDVAATIRAPRAPYDVIVLDVDNGPDGLGGANDGLYRQAGVRAARAALAPGGTFAVWSSFESATFTRWLRAAFADVTLHRVRARAGVHWIWLAR
jgi:spermidine synthase